jgi:threonine/homoserine/homoserine lactone efflux protein
MMDGAALAIFAGALLINSATPGPSVAALVARVVWRGPREIVPFLAAMWIGEGLWLAAAVFGLAMIAQSFHAAFVAIRLCGVAYLLYLAWRMWNAETDVDGRHNLPKGSPVRLFFAGLSITLGNPKIMIFYLALLPAIIDVATINGPGFAALVVTMTAVLMGVDLFWVALAGGARRFIRSRKAMKLANRCGAAAMGGAAAAIAVR